MNWKIRLLIAAGLALMAILFVSDLAFAYMMANGRPALGDYVYALGNGNGFRLIYFLGGWAAHALVTGRVHKLKDDKP